MRLDLAPRRLPEERKRSLPWRRGPVYRISDACTARTGFERPEVPAAPPELEPETPVEIPESPPETPPDVTPEIPAPAPEEPLTPFPEGLR